MRLSPKFGKGVIVSVAKDLSIFAGVLRNENLSAPLFVGKKHLLTVTSKGKGRVKCIFMTLRSPW
jgi:hypothetical protein